MRITVRVRPGASRTKVGGRYGDALVVAVQAPAVDGRATAAVLEAVADVFGVRPRQVTMMVGATNRTKVLDVEVDEPTGRATLARLLDE